jgi:hypothetical protein
MSEATLAVVALLVFGWAVSSGALARHDITGPISFTVAGFVLANPDWGVLTVDVETGTVHTIAEVTLALVLFSDAARVNLTELRRDIVLSLRLLAIGLPLTLIIGGVTAASAFDDFTWALAGFVGAAMAPTDAALSTQVINDQRVPGNLRGALNVESGLNDGIATPVVTFMLAVAAAQLGLAEEGETATMGGSAGDLVIGIGLGLLFGLGGAIAVNAATRRDWVVGGGRRIATLAVALGAFAAALAIECNGFIAAFVAGIALWVEAGRHDRRRAGLGATGAGRTAPGIGCVVSVRSDPPSHRLQPPGRGDRDRVRPARSQGLPHVSGRDRHGGLGTRLEGHAVSRMVRPKGISLGRVCAPGPRGAGRDLRGRPRGRQHGRVDRSAQRHPPRGNRRTGRTELRSGGSGRRFDDRPTRHTPRLLHHSRRP